MEKRFGGLWRHPDFMKLWSGQTISVFGSNITREGLPYAAVLVLAATPFQMGLLLASSALPVVLVGLMAGVWVDRLRRRPVMIIADLIRAVLVGSIPVAAFLGALGMAQLYVVAFLVGLLTVFFEVANHAYLPGLVEREHLVEANSKLGASSSIAEIGGPPLAGVLVQFLTAPIAIIIDAVSFVVSALLLGLIRRPEAAPDQPEQRPKIWPEIAEGLRLVRHTPILRALMIYTVCASFFGTFFGAFYALYALNELKLEPWIVGILVGLGGIGSLAGAALAGPVLRRFGLGRTMLWTLVLGHFLQILTPLAFGPKPVVILCMLLPQLFADGIYTIFLINELSLRQTIVPDRLLGRANASVQFLVGGVSLVGPLVAGLLGNLIGIRLCLLIAVIGFCLSTLPVIFSPIRHLRDFPAPAEEAEAAEAVTTSN